MPRPVWSGSIAFGLVSIPIELYTSTIDTTVRFHLVTPDGKCRLRRKLFCPETSKEYDFSETARGYEISPNQYVIVTPEELERLQPESGKTIELENFIDQSEVDPVFIERSYYAIPKKDGAKAYSLLHQALRKSNKIGLGEFIMREKEHLAAIRAGEETLYVDLLHFVEEIKPLKEVRDTPPLSKVVSKELDLAITLIDNLTAKFDPGKYKDDYRKEVLKLLSRKAKGKTTVVDVQPATKEYNPKVIDIMSRLEQSLKSKRKAKVAPVRRKTSAKRSSGSSRRKAHK